jgi:hypothetical protein
MEAAAFDDYTERLRASLALRREVIGLVTLGTTADPTFRDEWSDHDFWVITKTGAQDTLVNDLSWLPEADDIAIVITHGKHGRTVLYHNRHKVEFAVLDATTARQGKSERYQILIDRGETADLMKSIHEDTLEQAKVRKEALENLCVLVWSACERHYRGEFLSARQYLDVFAVNQLLGLISTVENKTSSSRDALDPRRRLEIRSPALAAELIQIIKNPVPEGGLQLLAVAEREVKPMARNLAWDKLTMVRSWIQESITADTRE